MLDQFLARFLLLAWCFGYSQKLTDTSFFPVSADLRASFPDWEWSFEVMSSLMTSSQTLPFCMLCTLACQRLQPGTHWETNYFCTHCVAFTWTTMREERDFRVLFEAFDRSDLASLLLFSDRIIDVPLPQPHQAQQTSLRLAKQAPSERSG